MIEKLTYAVVLSRSPLVVQWQATLALPSLDEPYETGRMQLLCVAPVRCHKCGLGHYSSGVCPNEACLTNGARTAVADEPEYLPHHSEVARGALEHTDACAGDTCIVCECIAGRGDHCDAELTSAMAQLVAQNPTEDAHLLRGVLMAVYLDMQRVAREMEAHFAAEKLRPAGHPGAGHLILKLPT